MRPNPPPLPQAVAVPPPGDGHVAVPLEHVPMSSPVSVKPPLAIYVYEWPVRVWHWVTTLCMIVLVITGYFIAKPLHTLGGEASQHFFNGWVRTGHFIAAYTLAIGFVARAWWAIVGNHHAREIFFLPITKKTYWKELFDEFKWYALLSKVPGKFTGHNPLARTAMFGMFVLGTAFIILSGFGLYSEQSGPGSWQSALFGWTISVAGSSMMLRTWHHLAMWWLLIFSMIHMYLVFREDIMGRTSMASTMISGWRLFRDDRPDGKED
jgi:Ni/Fe-hydrogenase 1 B-type cytochrome subunit